jgi:CTP:molybdopterin cytidylyltransferase MocA
MCVESSDVVMLVLASGRGNRIGGPKALLHWTDGHLLATAHANTGSMVCGRVVVVARAYVATLLRPHLSHEMSNAMVVTSSAPGPLGPAGSIAAAVRAGVLRGMSWSLVTPVDAVPVVPSTIRSLYSAAVAGVQAVRPHFEGRGGHPVLIRSEILSNAYLAERPDPLRDVLRSVRCAIACVDDPRVVIDINTPDAYEAWTKMKPQFES